MQPLDLHDDILSDVIRTQLEAFAGHDPDAREAIIAVARNYAIRYLKRKVPDVTGRPGSYLAYQFLTNCNVPEEDRHVVE